MMKKYIVKQGDRWDTIAYEFYGDPYLYEPILRANPQFLGLPYPPPGAVVYIPYIDIYEEGDSPPWLTD